MIPSDKKQRQIIKIAQKQLCIDDEDYRDVMEDNFGVRSSTKLSKLQAAKFISIFKEKGFRTVRKWKTQQDPRPRLHRPRPTGENVVCLPSAAQIQKINVLSSLIHWKYEDGLELWMKARLKIDKVRTAGNAHLVIEGLKKLFENQMKKEYGSIWWAGTYDDPAIMRYITEHKS